MDSDRSCLRREGKWYTERRVYLSLKSLSILCCFQSFNLSRESPWKLFTETIQENNARFKLYFWAWKKIDLLSLNSLSVSKDITRIRLKQWPTSFVEESLSWSLSFRDWVTQRDSFMFHTDFHFSCDCVGNKFCCRFLWQQLQSNTCRNAIVSFLSHSIFFFVVCDEDSREFHLVPSSILESLLVSWCSVQLELFSLLPSSYTCDVVSCLSCLSSLCVNRRLFAPTNSLITSRSLLTREQFSLMFVADSDPLQVSSLSASRITNFMSEPLNFSL